MADVDKAGHVNEIEETGKGSNDGSFAKATQKIRDEMAGKSVSEQTTFFQELTNNLHQDHFLPDFEVITGVTRDGQFSIRDNLPNEVSDHNVATFQQLEAIETRGASQIAEINSPVASRFQNGEQKAFFVHSDQTIQTVGDNGSRSFTKLDGTQIAVGGSGSTAWSWVTNPDKTQIFKEGIAPQLSFRADVVSAIHHNEKGLIDKIEKSEGKDSTSRRGFEYDSDNKLNHFVYTKADGAVDIYDKVQGESDSWAVTKIEPEKPPVMLDPFHGMMDLDSKTGNFTIAEKNKPVVVEKLDGSKLELDESNRVRTVTKINGEIVTVRHVGTTNMAESFTYTSGHKTVTLRKGSNGRWEGVTPNGDAIAANPDDYPTDMSIDAAGNIRSKYQDEAVSTVNTDGSKIYIDPTGKKTLSSEDSSREIAIAPDGSVVRVTKHSDGTWVEVEKRSSDSQITTTWDKPPDTLLPTMLAVEAAKLSPDGATKIAIKEDLKLHTKTLVFGDNFLTWDDRGRVTEKHVGNRYYKYLYDKKDKLTAWVESSTDGVVRTHQKGKSNEWTTTIENDAPRQSVWHGTAEMDKDGNLIRVGADKRKEIEKADGSKITFDRESRVRSVQSSDMHVTRIYGYAGSSNTPNNIMYLEGANDAIILSYANGKWTREGTEPPVTLAAASVDANGTYRQYDATGKTTMIETTDRKIISQTDRNGVIVRDLLTGTVTTDLKPGKSAANVLAELTPSFALAGDLRNSVDIEDMPGIPYTLTAVDSVSRGDSNPTRDTSGSVVSRRLDSTASGEPCYNADKRAADWWLDKRKQAKEELLRAIKEEHKTEVQGVVGLTLWDVAAIKLLAKMSDEANQPLPPAILKEMLNLQKINQFDNLCDLDLAKLNKPIKLVAPATDTSN